MIRYVIEIKNSAMPVYLADSKVVTTDRRSKTFMTFTTAIKRAWKFRTRSVAEYRLKKLDQPWLTVCDHEWCDVPNEPKTKRGES